MDKKIAVVTGGNRGIGFQVCRDIAKKGFKVLLTARNSEKGMESAEILQSEGLDVTFYELDVSSAESIDTFYNRVAEEFGRIDVLVNNAAIIPDARSSGLSLEIQELQVSLETNVYGIILLSQKIITLMIKNNYGRIINMSSGMGQFADMGSGYLAYRISKTAVNTITKVLANETDSHNIQINSVDPGWVKTEMGGAGASLSVEEGADTIVWLSTQPDDSPTGMFYKKRKIIPW
ncbi:MAG: SDR family oxidoreductase [Candidatus Marinimicrobia bacterium]|nr:SDR family oxidoreductase [Candidatus Neomarinimicrobiota bacterium]